MDKDEVYNRVYSVVENSLSLDKAIEASDYENITEKIIDDILPIWEVPSSVVRTRGNINAFLPRNYVIPDQDLKLFETALSLATASSVINLSIPELANKPGGLITAIIAIIAAILRLLNNLKLAVHLDKYDHTIMVLLGGARETGLSVQALFKTMQVNFPDTSIEELKQRLDELKARATIDGTKSALVWQGEHEYWHTNGV